MDFSTLAAKDVLVDNALPEYEEELGFFYSELVDLNVNIYILDQIFQFPFDLFVPRDETIFWNGVVRNFFNAGVLSITRLATDKAADLHTLINFKNRVRELIKPEYKNSFDEHLRQARFDRETHVLLERARQLRVNHIAHTRRVKDSESEKLADLRLDFTEMKELRDALNSLLDALSFNVENRLLPIPYDPDVLPSAVGDSRPDIEKLLDCLAKESYLLNMPERYPERWQNRRVRFSQDKIGQINHYRRKFNLPEV
jgi:hypothetical protein